MKKGFAPILIILLVLGSVVVGAGSMFFFTEVFRKPESLPGDTFPTNSPTASPAESPCSIPEGCPPEEPGTGNWKTFTSKDGKHTISYPSDWTLTDKSEKSTIYPDATLTNIEISKNSHKIISYELDGWGPAACLYDGEKQPDNPIAFDAGKYVEISAEQGKFRRSDDGESKSGQLHWTVCSNLENGSFLTVAAIGIKSYQTPISYDKELIETMDQILATYKLRK